MITYNYRPSSFHKANFILRQLAFPLGLWHKRGMKPSPNRQWKSAIQMIFEESARLKLLCAEKNWEEIQTIALLIVRAFKKGNKLLLFGNGGSAADAQHIAAEFVNRFLKKRISMPAIALTTDTSILTSVGNDEDFSRVFAKQISAIGNKGDIALGISTSGASANLIEAFRVSKDKGIIRVGLLGRDGGRALKFVDHAIVVPSNSTPRIQEAHITIGHIICEIVEGELFKGTGYFSNNR